MRPRHTLDENSRFRGSVRHYHRAAHSNQTNWDQWINGTTTTAKRSRNWTKILLLSIGSLALLGVVIGLVIEMR
jgi:hypothetical protein